MLENEYKSIRCALEQIRKVQKGAEVDVNKKNQLSICV